jgi:nucleoside phosphorylase
VASRLAIASERRHIVVFGGSAGGLDAMQTGCGGPLWERSERGVVQFTCYVGHSFTGESLAEQHGNAVEEAMWTAMFADRAAIIRHALVLEDPLGTADGAEDVKRIAARAKRAATERG